MQLFSYVHCPYFSMNFDVCTSTQIFFETAFSFFCCRVYVFMCQREMEKKISAGISQAYPVLSITPVLNNYNLLAETGWKKQKR